MISSLKQEAYKFIQQKTPIWGIVVLFILMLYTALTGNVTSSLVIQGFGLGQWVIIIVIAIASDFIAMEFRDYTIDTLFYKHSNKFVIYLAKFLVVMLYGLFLLVVGILITLLFAMIFYKNKLPWMTIYANHQTLLESFSFNLLGTLIYMFFMAALGFFLICWLKNNALVIVIGLLIVFLGASLSTALMSSVPSLIFALKWNPLNMIYAIDQLGNKSYILTSHLGDFQISVGTIFYGLVFFATGYFIFKHRQV